MNKQLALGVLLAFSGTAATAATVSFTDSFPPPPDSVETTNWTTTLQLSQFDPSLGVLTGVSFAAEARVDGTARAESLDMEEATITLTIGADVEIDMSAASIGNFLFAGIGDSQSFNLSAFDLAIDFGGTSGVDNIALAGSDSASQGAAPGAAFIGLGMLDFGASASGASIGTGAGNLVTQFATNAGVDLTVTYTYEERPPVDVPVPAPLALMGLGLAALGMRRRKA